MGKETSYPPGMNPKRIAALLGSWALRMAVVATAGLGLLTLLGLLSPDFWLADRAADLRVQVALALAILGLALAITRHLAIAAGASVLAVINLLLLWPLLAPGMPRVVPGWWPSSWLPAPAMAAAEPFVPLPHQSLEVFSLNVWYRNRDYRAVRDAVRATGPDVAVFLEVTPRWARELALLRDGWPHQQWVRGEGHDGVMILSRVPWRAAHAVVLSGEGGAEAVRVTLDLGGQPVEVVGAHLRWPVTPDSARARAASLAGLATLVRGLPHPVVVVGDLNLTPHDGAFARLLSAAGLANAAARSGLLTTWPAATGPVARRLPGLQIDYCLVSQGILTEALTVGPWVGSDHRPVLARLSVPLGFNAPAADRSTSPP